MFLNDFVMLMKLTIEKLQLSELEAPLLLLAERAGSLLNSISSSCLHSKTLSAG